MATEVPIPCKSWILDWSRATSCWRKKRWVSEGKGSWLKVGERVLVKEKGFEGTARFVGTTDFAPGYWIGVELPHSCKLSK